MKKSICTLILLVCVAGSIFSQSGSEKVKVYYNLIANDSKTVDYTVGVYPDSYAYVSKESGGYSTITMRIINNSVYTMNWSRHSKVFILLKSGTLICNYLTKAEEGVNACSYGVSPKESHEESLCFDKIFSAYDIDKMWLFDSDEDTTYELMFDEL